MLVNILLSETRIRNSPENIPSVTICYQLFDHWNSTRKENNFKIYKKNSSGRWNFREGETHILYVIYFLKSAFFY